MTPRMVEFKHGNGTYSLAVPADSDGVSEVAAFLVELDKASASARRMVARGPSIRGVQRLPAVSGRLSSRQREAAMSRVVGHSMMVSASSVVASSNNDEERDAMSRQVDSMKASEVASILGFSGTPRVYQLAKDGRLVKTADGISRASVEAYRAAHPGGPGRRGRPVGSKNGKPVAAMAGRVQARAKAASPSGGRWSEASLGELVAELEAVKAEIIRKIGA